VSDVGYDDGLVRVDEDGLTLARYYFPFATSKHIPFDQIRAIDVRPMGWLTGRLRGWGTTHPRFWLQLDPRRFRKTTLISLDIGRRVHPAFTPADPDAVLQLLRARVNS
jgi:hypothetical protein